MIAITFEANQLEVSPLSSSEWIVSDAAVAKNEGVGVVAYIESRLGVFELLELNKPPSATTSTRSVQQLPRSATPLHALRKPARAKPARLAFRSGAHLL